jgi:hypothetical protein
MIGAQPQSFLRMSNRYPYRLRKSSQKNLRGRRHLVEDVHIESGKVRYPAQTCSCCRYLEGMS